jgi:hypothetical protein
MPITVKLMGDLGRFADSPTMVLKGGQRSLAEALAEVVDRYPALEAELFDGLGRLTSAMLLVVGGRSLSWPDEGDMTIDDGGELLLMRFLAGG